MNQQITTELLESLNACQEGIDLVATYPNKDHEAVIRRLVADDHWNWANWLLPRLMDYRGYVSYAVFAAELVLPIYEKKHPNDNRPRLAIEAAQKCIDEPNYENNAAARAAAWAACAEAREAARAARAAAWAEATAAEAAWAAWAACAEAREAARAARAAAEAAEAAAAAAAWAACAGAAGEAAEAAEAAAWAEATAARAAAWTEAARAADGEIKNKIIEKGLEILRNN